MNDDLYNHGISVRNLVADDNSSSGFSFKNVPYEDVFKTPQSHDELAARITKLEAALKVAKDALIPLDIEASARSHLIIGPDNHDWSIGGSSLALRHLVNARTAIIQIDEVLK